MTFELPTVPKAETFVKDGKSFDEFVAELQACATRLTELEGEQASLTKFQKDRLKQRRRSFITSKGLRRDAYDEKMRKARAASAAPSAADTSVSITAIQEIGKTTRLVAHKLSKTVNASTRSMTNVHAQATLHNVAPMGTNMSAENVAPMGPNMSAENVAPMGTNMSAENVAPMGTNMSAENVAPMRTNMSAQNVAPMGTNMSAQNVAPMGTNMSAENVAPLGTSIAPAAGPSASFTPARPRTFLGKRARENPIMKIIERYQDTGRSESLPFHCIVVTGVPSAVSSSAPIFKNHVTLRENVAPMGTSMPADNIAPLLQHLSGLSTWKANALMTLVREECALNGQNSVIRKGRADLLLPWGCDAEMHEFIRVLEEMARRPGPRLLMQGSERTSDMWIWRSLWELLFLPDQGVTIFYGEVQAEATARARGSVGRSEDWIITASESIGRRGLDIGVGDSLGNLEFGSSGARAKICKSGRSARDMALALPRRSFGDSAGVLWVIQSQKHCIIFVVRRRTSTTVLAEYLGHCVNPLLGASSNMPHEVAKAVSLFLRARAVVRHAVGILDLADASGDDDSASDVADAQHLPSPTSKPSGHSSPVIKRPRLVGPVLATRHSAPAPAPEPSGRSRCTIM
ncbi:hypothetical protein HDU88_008544 [Geranomyces variabilis]|nr:hypothetical protein HDU88_008544 [Geranomyces variabilis]